MLFGSDSPLKLCCVRTTLPREASVSAVCFELSLISLDRLEGLEKPDRMGNPAFGTQDRACVHVHHCTPLVEKCLETCCTIDLKPPSCTTLTLETNHTSQQTKLKFPYWSRKLAKIGTSH